MSFPILDSRDPDSATRVSTFAARLRGDSGRRIVFTNGCFDIIHAGHIRLLKAAREKGDVLVVGLNTDESVRRLKGPSRPRVPQSDRAIVVSAIRFVDEIVFFEDDTPLGTILALKPDVLVKGADYAESEIVGADEVRGWGGEVIRVELLKGRSTTALLGGYAG